ncbi:MAG: hypothetical protein HS110_08365 [Zoogloeaceae bacterium]|nr:hypothetical protein [Zoogloeaceae bacterium]
MFALLAILDLLAMSHYPTAVAQNLEIPFQQPAFLASHQMKRQLSLVGKAERHIHFL